MIIPLFSLPSVFLSFLSFLHSSLFFHSLFLYLLLVVTIMFRPSVAMGLFYTWSRCCSILGTHLNSALQEVHPENGPVKHCNVNRVVTSSKPAVTAIQPWTSSASNLLILLSLSVRIHWLLNSCCLISAGRRIVSWCIRTVRKWSHKRS